jgi:hypothetical protein
LKRGTVAYLDHSASAFLTPPDLPEAATEATMMSFDSFPKHNFQFVPYNGPLELSQPGAVSTRNRCQLTTASALLLMSRIELETNWYQVGIVKAVVLAFFDD